MSEEKEICIFIPVRVNSTRLKDKWKIEKDGKPLLLHTIQRVIKEQHIEIHILTDSTEVQEAVDQWRHDYKLSYVKTLFCTVFNPHVNYLNGTARIQAYLAGIPSYHDKIIYNWQSEWPNFSGKLRRDIQPNEVFTFAHPDGTQAKTKVVPLDRYKDTNWYQAVFFTRDLVTSSHGHIGIYGFDYDTLMKYPQENCTLADTFSLEQLNWYSIPGITVNYELISHSLDYGIDDKWDLRKWLGKDREF